MAQFEIITGRPRCCAASDDQQVVPTNQIELLPRATKSLTLLGKIV
jgi:hypothetical protein